MLMNENDKNPIKPYGNVQGEHAYCLTVKSHVFKLRERLRRIIWEKKYDSESNGPVETQERRDKRCFHNRNRRSYEDNA